MRLLDATVAEAAAAMAARYRLVASGHRLQAASAEAVRADRLTLAAREATRLALRYAALATALRGRDLGRATVRRVSLDPAVAGELLQLFQDLSVRAPLADRAA